MKIFKIISLSSIILLLVVPPAELFSQNTGIGIATPLARLHISGNANTSQLIIDASPTQTNAQPLIRLRNAAGADLLWIHSDKTQNTFVGLNTGKVNTGIYNSFIGSDAGASNTSGNYNTGLGYSALNKNTTGYGNTALGYVSFQNNTIGYENTAIGRFALSGNTSGNFNTATGTFALDINTSGSYNTANGAYALYLNSGVQNTACGYGALYNNQTGSYNDASGVDALRNTTGSNTNTADGFRAGYSFNNGWNNVFMGAYTDVDGTGYYNVVAVGDGTIVSGSSTARFGNASTVSYGGWAGWTNISDGRFKKNIVENVPGLAFINMLRPITYRLDAIGLDNYLHKNDNKENKLFASENKFHQQALHEKEEITYTGFIAQEVELASKSLGFDFSGVDTPKSENDTYGLRYAEFVVPLVKAVQEQQQQIEDLRKSNEQLQKEMKELRNLVLSKK